MRIEDRVGSDVAPLDATTPEGALGLTSYVWPDQAARPERLTGALRLARERPVEVRTQDAAAFVEGLALRPGATLTVWHSVMGQYAPPAQQQRFIRRLAELGERGGRGREAGEREVLGQVASHGVPTTWETPPLPPH